MPLRTTDTTPEPFQPLGKPLPRADEAKPAPAPPAAKQPQPKTMDVSDLGMIMPMTRKPDHDWARLCRMPSDRAAGREAR